MMARKWSQGQLDACAVFHAFRDRDDLLNVADILARMDDRKFESVISAFRMYRNAIREQLGAPEGKTVRRLRRAA